MIYTDGVHLISDTSLDELHQFAAKLGLKREWIHKTPGRPHYDLITPRVRQQAIEQGAKLAGRREFVAALRRNPNYKEWKSSLHTGK